MVSVDVLDPRRDPEPDYWPALRSTAGLLACWDYGLLRIAAWCERYPLLLAVARDGGRPVGLMCASWVGVPVRMRSYVSSRRRPWAGLLNVRIPASMSSPGWWLSPDLDLPARREVLRGLLRGIRREVGPLCTGVLWRQVGDDDLPTFTGRLRVVRETLPLAVLSTRFRDLDEWLGTLGSDRRQNLRRRGRKIDADPTLRFSVSTGQDLDLPQMVSLARLHERKHEVPMWGRLPLPGSYFDALRSRSDVLMMAYHDDTGRLLAYNIVLDDPQWPIAMYYAGLPPELGGRGHLYFDQFRRLMAWAIDGGRQGLIWGKGLHELKSDLGAQILRQHVVARPAVTW